MLPDLDSLRCFDAAATHLNFRAASQAVALSPAAFSTRIRELEEQLGEALFERTTRRVSLTAAGARLVDPVRRILKEAGGLKALAGSDEVTPYVITLGTRFELGLSWITPNLSALKRSEPARTLRLVFGDSPELLDKMQGGTLDAVVTSHRLTSARLRYTALHREDYAFVMSPKLRQARRLQDAEDAAKHTLIDAHPDLPLFRYFLDTCPAEEVWAFGAVEYLGTIAAIRMRVLEGAGVAVLPRYFVEEDLRRKRLCALFAKRILPSDVFRLVWKKGHMREPELLRLGAALRRIPLR